MESEPTAPAPDVAPDVAPVAAADAATEPSGHRPPAPVALLPARSGARRPRGASPAWDWVLAAPLGATKTLLDLTDAAADRLAELLGLRREAP